MFDEAAPHHLPTNWWCREAREGLVLLLVLVLVMVTGLVLGLVLGLGVVGEGFCHSDIESLEARQRCKCLVLAVWCYTKSC